jgi:hypothetical protein
MNYKIINPVRKSTREGKKLMVTVQAKGQVKTIHFGDTNYKHNYSKKAWESYMARSAGIRDKQGRLTKDNPLSANFWSRKELWSRK